MYVCIYLFAVYLLVIFMNGKAGCGYKDEEMLVMSAAAEQNSFPSQKLNDYATDLFIYNILNVAAAKQPFQLYVVF